MRIYQLARFGKSNEDKLEQDNIMETVQLAEKFRAMELSDKCADFLLDKIDALGEEELANMSPGVVLSTVGRKAMSELKRKGRRSSSVGSRGPRFTVLSP